MHLATQKNRADAELYHLQKQAEANKLLLTPEYLELKKYEALTNSAKLFYGPDVPKMFASGGCRDLSELELLNQKPILKSVVTET